MRITTQIIVSFLLVLGLFGTSSGIVILQIQNAGQDIVSLMNRSATLDGASSSIRLNLSRFQQSILALLQFDEAGGTGRTEDEIFQLLQSTRQLFQQGELRDYFSHQQQSAFLAALLELQQQTRRIAESHQNQKLLSKQTQSLRNELANQIAMADSVLDRVTPRYIREDYFLRKELEEFLGQRSAINDMTTRAFFASSSQDIQQLKENILNSQEDYLDFYSVLLEDFPALNQEADFLAASEQFSALMFGLSTDPENRRPTDVGIKDSGEGGSLLDLLKTQAVNGEIIREQLTAQTRTLTKLNHLVGKVSETLKQESQQNGQVIANRLQSVNHIQLVVMLGCLLLVLITGLYLSKRIRKPLKYCLRKMVLLAEGDYSQKIETNWPTEFAELTRQLSKVVSMNGSLFEQIKRQSADIYEISLTNSSRTHSVKESGDEQLQAVSRIASAVCELERTSSHVHELARNHLEQSQEISRIADEGKAATVANHFSNQQLQAQIHTSSGVIDDVSQKSQDISQILEVIENIANQTNLLALNAAIEAARAGEQGRGFAVVADEVRDLAKRTTNATAQIQQMIEHLQDASLQAVTNMRDCNRYMEQNFSAVQKSNETIETINEKMRLLEQDVHLISQSTQEQHMACAEISESLEGIALAFSQNTTTASEVAQQSQDLAERTLHQQDELSRIKTSKAA